MTAWLRHPLLHFFAAGAVLLVAAKALEPLARAWSTPTIHVTAADIYQLRQQWQREAGIPPRPDQLSALVSQHIDEAILFEEALLRGLHEEDPVVRDRLLRNMQFLAGSESAADEALLRDARAMGMLERDPVVRRRLIQRMRHRLESTAMVDATAVAAAAAEHFETTASPYYSFEHVFFSADQRASPMVDAEEALSSVATTAGATAPGDPFLLGAALSGQTTDALTRRFGAAFSTAVAEAPVGAWHGPVRSRYGAHLIRVTAGVARPETQGPTLRQAVLHARQTAEKQVLRDALTQLRQRYRIVRETGAVETAMQQ